VTTYLWHTSSNADDRFEMIRLKENRNRRDVSVRYVWYLTGAIVPLFASVMGLMALDVRVSDVIQNQDRILRLAERLRLSSEELTETARRYVITGDPRFKRRHAEIGYATPEQVPHSLIGLDAYLEPRKPNATESTSPSTAIYNARISGMSDASLSRAQAAVTASEDLARLEALAMRRAESSRMEEQLAAISMLYDRPYLDAKAQIMRPIAQLEDTARATARKELEQINKCTVLARWIAGISGALALAVLQHLFFAIRWASASESPKFNRQNRSDEAKERREVGSSASGDEAVLKARSATAER